MHQRSPRPERRAVALPRVQTRRKHPPPAPRCAPNPTEDPPPRARRSHVGTRRRSSRNLTPPSLPRALGIRTGDREHPAATLRTLHRVRAVGYAAHAAAGLAAWTLAASSVSRRRAAEGPAARTLRAVANAAWAAAATAGALATLPELTRALENARAGTGTGIFPGTGTGTGTGIFPGCPRGRVRTPRSARLDSRWIRFRGGAGGGGARPPRRRPRAGRHITRARRDDESFWSVAGDARRRLVGVG